MFFNAIRTAVECSAALPTIATTITPTKTSVSPSVRLASSTAPTSTSLIQATKAVATSRTTDDFRLTPAATSWRAASASSPVGVVQVLVRDEAEDQVQDVGDDQDHADRQAQLVLDAGGVGADQRVEDRRDDQADGGQDHQGRAHARGRPVERWIEDSEPARQQARPQDQQEVADDAARQRRLDHVVEPLEQREQGDDQLGGVAEGGVQKAPDARPEPVRERLGRLADQPGQRDDGQRRQAELRRPPGHRVAHAIRATGMNPSSIRSQPTLPRVDPVVPRHRSDSTGPLGPVDSASRHLIMPPIRRGRTRQYQTN